MSHYAVGLELLGRVREQIEEFKPQIMSRDMTVQSWYALSQNWNLLREDLIATGEIADAAALASKRQRAKTRTYSHLCFRYSYSRDRQADSCLRQFRYVTALSQHSRAVMQHHETALRSWENYQDHYEAALSPDAHAVRAHRKFLDELGSKIESVKRQQPLEKIYVRWLQLKAATDLKKQAKNFHLAHKAMEFQKDIVDKAYTRLEKLQRDATQYIEEYDHLEREVVILQSAMQALWDSRPDAGNAAVSASMLDENAEQVARAS